MESESMNLLIDQDQWFRQILKQLQAPFPVGTVQKREKGDSYYIPVQVYIHRLNHVAGTFWSFRITGQIIHEREDLVQINGILKLGQGEYEGTGFSNLQRYRDTGKISNLKNAVSSASSDCLRSCCDLLQIGWVDLAPYREWSKNPAVGMNQEIVPEKVGSNEEKQGCLVCRQALKADDILFIQRFNSQNKNREITKPYCREHIPSHFLRKS